ncbi:MAG TPA: prephenate dehydrogenase/arogenate dehydrogenase family protein [Candidatus Saccharimonadia bacterium]
MKTVGIIGFGTFGRFMAAQLAPYLSVLVDEARVSAAEAKAAGAKRVPYTELGAADVVIPSVPVQALEGVLQELDTVVRPGALVADVSSVKVIPVELMQALLPPGVEILATHPLFGPQSGAQGIAGLPMVVWPVRVRAERYERIRRFLGETLGR